MKHIIRKRLFLVPALTAALCASSAAADTLTTSDGKAYDNVRLLYAGRLVIVIFKDGKVKRVPAGDIRSTEFKQVDWDRPDLRRQIAELRRKVFRMADIERQRDASLWRGVLYPGWGHLQGEQKARAWIYMGVSAGLLLKYWMDRREQSSLQAEYDRVDEPVALALIGPAGFAANVLRFEDLKARNDAKARAGNQALLLYGLLWFWNLYELYDLNDPDRAFRAAASVPAGSLSVRAARRSLNVAYEFRF